MIQINRTPLKCKRTPFKYNKLLLQIVLCHLLSGLLLAEPIEKKPVEKITKIKTPDLVPTPEINHDPLFGNNTTFPDDSNHGNNDAGRKKDYVCESKANAACKARCISMTAACFCATNGKTYRNQCEMGCMRKVNMEHMNWKHFGMCEAREEPQPATEEIVEAVCPAEAFRNYVRMVKDLMVTEYLKAKVKRCSRLVNCLQARKVLEFTSKDGNQSISDCSDLLPVYLLFTGHTACTAQISRSKSELNLVDYLYHFLLILSTNYVSHTMEEVFDNNPIINCAAAKRVSNRLFNKKNCAREQNEPDPATLIQWSFDLLDKDEDLQLSEDELKMLEYIPDEKTCRKAFFSQCDKNLDDMIREDEWSECLGCLDCYRPCYVLKAKKREEDRRRRYTQSDIKCNADGSCASKQCEIQWSRHRKCWCVDSRCNKIEGTESYTEQDC